MHQSISEVDDVGTQWSVDGNLAMFESNSQQLHVEVGEVPDCQHRVIRIIDARDDVKPGGQSACLQNSLDFEPAYVQKATCSVSAK